MTDKPKAVNKRINRNIKATVKCPTCGGRHKLYYGRDELGAETDVVRLFRCGGLTRIWFGGEEGVTIEADEETKTND